MAKYLEKEQLVRLNESRQTIQKQRNELYSDTGVDVLDNDTMSNLALMDIVTQYDPDFNCNFSRNGEDAKTKEVCCEIKTSKVNKRKRKEGYPFGVFQFHAMGNLVDDMFLFALRDKATLELYRIYDIRSSDNVNKIIEELQALQAEWIDKPPTKSGYDVISIKEQNLQKIPPIKTEIINDCEIIHL